MYVKTVFNSTLRRQQPQWRQQQQRQTGLSETCQLQVGQNCRYTKVNSHKCKTYGSTCKADHILASIKVQRWAQEALFVRILSTAQAAVLLASMACYAPRITAVSSLTLTQHTYSIQIIISHLQATCFFEGKYNCAPALLQGWGVLLQTER